MVLCIDCFELNKTEEDLQNLLRWFRQVKQKPTDVTVRRCDYETEAQRKRDRGRPMKTWKEILKKYMEYLELTKYLVQNPEQ